MAREVSEEAMIKASGHGREHWYPLLDDLSKQHEKRSDLTKAFHAEYSDSVSAWWCQMITVQWEIRNDFICIPYSPKRRTCSPEVPSYPPASLRLEANSDGNDKCLQKTRF